MNKFFIPLLCMLMQAYVQSAQQVLFVQDQKPTAEELQQYWAAQYAADQIIFDLLEKYGERIVNEKDPLDPIIFSAIVNSEKWTLEKFEKLLNAPGIDLNAKNSNQQTPLGGIIVFFSCFTPDDISLQKFKLLIQCGADMECCDSWGFTVLMKAAYQNMPQYVTVLLNAGASTNGYVAKGGHAGKTFFDFAKEHLGVQQVYETYRQKLHARLVEVLNVAEMPELIEEYLFAPLPIDQEKIEVALEEYRKQVAEYENDDAPDSLRNMHPMG